MPITFTDKAERARYDDMVITADLAYSFVIKCEVMAKDALEALRDRLIESKASESAEVDTAAALEIMIDVVRLYIKSYDD